MEIIGYVFVIIAFARLLAEGFERLGYPGFLGEITAGMILSAILLEMPRDQMLLMAELGLFFLMISAGLEVTPEELHYAGRITLPLYVLTYIAMFVVTLPFTNWMISSDNIIVAAILSIASAPIVLRLKRFFGEDFLHVALSYAVISEVMSLFIVYIMVRIHENPGNYTPIVTSILKDAVFIGGIMYINYIIGIKQKVYIIRFLRRLKSDEAVFGLFMVFSTSLAFISEEIGMHFSIGGFLAGLMMHSDLVGTKQYDRLTTIVSGVTYGIFAPIFFAWRGLNFETELSLLVLEFFAVVYVARLILSAAVVRHKDVPTSIVRGAGIASFGVLGLLVGEIGYVSGVLSEHMYAMASLASVLGIFTSATLGRVVNHYLAKPQETVD
ncbi:NapA-type sodium/hydrogen antiporter [Thermococcus onnurineus NA1]|uniref:NapA-type sodium/hydrogen antiporter n=1 Tax=Thermococcus onnurineus (strain NA1) TaxID=523850 RepID=B6YXK1_THEON|nr:MULTISPECIES: cation:proton antiporter [Thermococcus]ACJ16814.1 NapA-type sodium/hydrogen antiporter [Thermococcus onnurineus NA1]NJE46840.1 cation:proton antiporter [Thermococcus sp. GR7]NJE78337.1 cation:proton antiporter [Thermococcus sp. GR4]NJF23366.1 cation:proton antiporter [Thermococcus sp. GR5]